MPVSYDQGGCTVKLRGGEAPAITKVGVEMSPAEMTPEDEQRPSWKTTRYPVDMEEFYRLCEKAREINEETLHAPPLSKNLPNAEEPAKALAVADYNEEAGLAPGVMSTFEGIPATGWRPPDCTCGVGSSHVLLSVNSDLAVYDKLGRKQGAWPDIKNFFGPVVDASAKVFDPRILYDHFSDRYIVIALATRNDTKEAWLLIGISQSADAMGGYWVWASDTTLNNDTDTNNWGDYPMVGYDEQAIYIMLNMFEFSGSFQYCKLRIHEKSELIDGGIGANHEISYWDMWNIKDSNTRTAFSINPCIHYRDAGNNLPAYMINAIWASNNALVMWQLDDPVSGWGTTGTTPSLTSSDVACMSYSLPPDATQKGSAVGIQTNDTRLLSAVYLDNGTNESLWTSHTSQVSWSGDTEARSCAQWYEINVSTKTIAQQNNFGASGLYYFFPALTVDQRGSAYMVMGRCSDGEYASLRETGRRPTDIVNEMRISIQIRAGEGPYAVAGTNRQRWGDYFTAVRDGTDKYKVWVYGEYAVKNNKWSTWAASLRI